MRCPSLLFALLPSSLNVKLTVMTDAQSEYLSLEKGGPYKSDHYVSFLPFVGPRSGRRHCYLS